ncbi:MAG: carbon monoxide dehydrogenase [Candidatus Rokuibacteriota bacterium]|nr:MAG: carbon monoxide dehydrogenase [Candidatus Rokubacteria bacterium]
MYPASFDYHTPGSVQEAITLLGKLRDDAKLLAGGHSLIPMMKLRLAQPKHLIDLRKVPGLAGIREDGGSIAIGAMTTHWQVESSKLLQAKIPVVSDAAGMIGDPQVRNLGTIGGSLAHADPAADMPAVMIALGAELVIEGPRGRRTVKVDDFFKGLMMTAVGPDEILAEIRVPVPPAGSGAAYQKFPHPASRFAVVGVCAALTVDGKGICTKAGVGVTGAGTRAVRAKGVEAGLAGKALDHTAIEAAAAKAADGVDVQADLQGSVEYKSHLVRVHARRAIEAALGRAKGGK